ncbi:MAG: hypothetical protein SGI97_00930 [candidate division Zixibacteria bacterium]|nr:hypothetical protein [candidate division Zixibacteria bacterium]
MYKSQQLEAKLFENRSRAVTLTVLELEKDRDILIPSYLLANLMSPSLWRWREARSAFSIDGELLGVRRRLKELERHFHKYTFTNFPDEPARDPWGLLQFSDESSRLGDDYISRAKQEYDTTLKMLYEENPQSQFGQIVTQDYYRAGFFPRLRNEIIEVMDAYAHISADKKGSGKCAALAFLWAAALIVWGRFTPDKITIIGNRSHVFVFLDEDDGHLFNNTKWFSRTRIQNASDISEFVKMVSTNTETTFLFNPMFGMCRCQKRQSDFQPQQLAGIFNKIGSFLSLPLKNPDPLSVEVVEPSASIPNPLEYNSAEEYHKFVLSLAERSPDSAFEYAQYTFREIDVLYPQVYICAALRDYHTNEAAKQIESLEDVFAIVRSIPRHDSLFHSRSRIALPDEVLLFRTGSDRDRALLLFTLLHQSPLKEEKMTICFAEHKSFVYHNHWWIDADNLALLAERPQGITKEFNSRKLIRNHE